MSRGRAFQAVLIRETEKLKGTQAIRAMEAEVFERLQNLGLSVTCVSRKAQSTEGYVAIVWEVGESKFDPRAQLHIRVPTAVDTGKKIDEPQFDGVFNIGILRVIAKAWFGVGYTSRVTCVGEEAFPRLELVIVKDRGDGVEAFLSFDLAE